MTKLIWLTLLFIPNTCDKKIPDKNYGEFNKAIINLEKQICGLKNYLIDTVGESWKASDPKGYYSFEGIKRRLNLEKNDEGYNIKLTSRFSSAEYFEKSPEIKLAYCIFRNNRCESKINETLNCGTESFEDYPFNIDSIKSVYKEKFFYFHPSKVLVFDRFLFSEEYDIEFKNGSKKRFRVDPVTRAFEIIK
jgi:hypothetical protein